VGDKCDLDAVLCMFGADGSDCIYSPRGKLLVSKTPSLRAIKQILNNGNKL
jgi:hypothetical protein